MRRPMHELPDENLMGLTAVGHPEAFDELVRRYDKRLINFIYRTIGRFDRAEELAQETFIRAFRAAERFDETRRFSTWLYTIARNLVNNELRDKARRSRRMRIRESDWDYRGVEQVADTAKGPLGRLEASELKENLERAMGTLSSDQRQALVLAEYEHMRYKDIAQIFNCPVGTIKAWIHRAKRKLVGELQALAGV